jgi:hypothetical protein
VGNKPPPRRNASTPPPPSGNGPRTTPPSTTASIGRSWFAAHPAATVALTGVALLFLASGLHSISFAFLAVIARVVGRRIRILRGTRQASSQAALNAEPWRAETLDETAAAESNFAIGRDSNLKKSLNKSAPRRLLE